MLFQKGYQTIALRRRLGNDVHFTNCRFCSNDQMGTSLCSTSSFIPKLLNKNSPKTSYSLAIAIEKFEVDKCQYWKLFSQFLLTQVPLFSYTSVSLLYANFISANFISAIFITFQIYRQIHKNCPQRRTPSLNGGVRLQNSSTYSPKKGVRLQNSSTYSPQKGVRLQNSSTKGVHLQISSTKRGFHQLQGQFLWIQRYDK